MFLLALIQVCFASPIIHFERSFFFVSLLHIQLIRDDFTLDKVISCLCTASQIWLQTVIIWDLFKWGLLDRAKSNFKMLSAPWNSIHCKKKSRSLRAKNFGSVGQRATKLLAVKVGVLKKKSAASAIPPKVCASAFSPSSSTPGVESFSTFDS